MTWWSPNFDASPLSSPDAGSDNESDQTLRSALPSPGGCFTPALCKYKPFQRLPQARGVRYHVSIYCYFKMCAVLNNWQLITQAWTLTGKVHFVHDIVWVRWNHCSLHWSAVLSSGQGDVSTSGVPTPGGWHWWHLPRASLTSVQNISTRTQNIWLLIIIHYVVSFGRHVPLG